MRQSEAMDFDDLIMMTLRLFDKNPEVLTYYQQRYLSTSMSMSIKTPTMPSIS